jgi:hypothetical protein
MDPIAAQLQQAAEKASKAVMPAAREIVARKLQEVLSRSTSRSSPGQPPHDALGRLRAGARVSVIQDHIVIESEVPFDEFLELGTRKMRPRPHAVTALDESQPAIAKALLAEFEKQAKSILGS